MKRIVIISMVCALAGVGVAMAQEHGRGECDHHGRGHGPGHMLRKMDANNDGRITRDEFQTATQEHFKRMDNNNDGVIAGDELQRGHDRHDDHGRHQGQHRGPAGSGG